MASASPYGTNLAPGTSGSKGSLYFSLCVILNAPMVLPWKQCSVAMKPLLPVFFRASFMAASMDSVPELAKNTRSIP